MVDVFGLVTVVSEDSTAGTLVSIDPRVDETRAEVVETLSDPKVVTGIEDTSVLTCGMPRPLMN